MPRLLLLLLTLIALTGCAVTRFENEPLADGAANSERRSVDVADKNRPVILVAISGGGARASALGWAVLRELRDYRYVNNDPSPAKSKGLLTQTQDFASSPSRGEELHSASDRMGEEPRRLIDDVAMISSVSGGSVIAAYYGLYGPDGLDQFEPDFLVPDNVGPLLSQILNPFNWIERALNGVRRSDTVERMFDDQLYHGKTFADLNQPGKPYIIINATDMASGEVFSLTPDRFDDICSDFDKLPVASGVAASSAVPVVLTPIAFKDYSVSQCQDRPVPAWIENRLNSPTAPYVNLEAYKRARYANDLRRGPGRYRDIQYIYLVDGGLADNLGLLGLADVYALPRGPGQILQHIKDGDIKKLVVIVINARADAPNPVYESPLSPGLTAMIRSAASVPIASASASNNVQINDLLRKVHTVAKDKINVYGVQIDLDQLRASDEHQRELRDKAKSIPTSWDITPEDRDTVKEVAQVLLRQHPCFQKLLMDMKMNALFVDPAFAKAGCVP
jgi:NTE family protein